MHGDQVAFDHVKFMPMGHGCSSRKGDDTLCTAAAVDRKLGVVLSEETQCACVSSGMHMVLGLLALRRVEAENFQSIFPVSTCYPDHPNTTVNNTNLKRSFQW